MALLAQVCASMLLAAAPELVVPGSGAPNDDVPANYKTVITGTRHEVRLKDSPIAVDVIGRDTIVTSGARTAADLLARHLGTAVASSFRGDGVEVQGLSARHVLVLIDGERMTGKTDEQLDLSRVPAESIERIEIVKGAASALYGSDAIGGVIHIITRRAARGATEGEVEVLAGGRGRAVLSGRVARRVGRVGFSLTVGLHRDDAYRLDASTPQTTGSAHDDVGTTLRLDWRPSDHARVDITAQHLYREQHGLDATTLPPDLEGRPRFRRVTRTDYLHTLSLRVAPKIELGDTQLLELTAGTSLSFDTLVQDQIGGTQYDRRQITFEQESSLGAQWSWSDPDARHRLTAGLEGHLERLVSERLEVASPDRERLAIYAEDQWRIVDAAPALTLVPGLRLDVDSQFGLALAPRVAVRCDPSEALVLRAGFGLGFRAPGFRELYLLFENPSVGYRVVGNPELRPETSRSLTIGAEWRATKAWTLSLDLFRHDVDDLITTELVAAGGDGDGNDGGLDRYSYVNVASATSQGFEARVAWLPAARVEVELGYAFTDARDDATDLPLVGRATHRLTLGASARLPELGGVDLGAQAELVGPRPLERDDGTRFDSGWDLIANARLGAPLGDHLQLVLGVDNLADAGDATSLPLRPRTIYGGIRGAL